MLSVRLPSPIEQELTAWCARQGVTKSHVVQEALAEYFVAAKAQATPAPPPAEPDLSFLAPDDPIRAFIGIAKGGPSTDEWMAITRGDDWNKP
jgi:hypothetical protein